MIFDSSQLSIVFIACGLGLVALGAVPVLVPPRRRGLQIVTWLAAALLSLAIAGMGSYSAMGAIALVIAAGVLAILVARSRMAARIAAAALVVLNSAAFRWGTVAAGGLALTAVGVLRIDQCADVPELQDVGHFEELGTMPACGPEPVAFAKSDCGTAIPLMAAADERDPDQLRTVELQILESQHWNDSVIRRRPAADNCNCHGWVFTGGRYWLHPDEVESILSENGYEPVSVPQLGDLTVYRTSGGAICHTAIVRAVFDDGVPLVEGKWGWMGVFLHRVGDSCYGREFTYYRSTRGGHLLAGLQPVMENRAGPPIRAE
jgi:hypothetical protein